MRQGAKREQVDEPAAPVNRYYFEADKNHLKYCRETDVDGRSVATVSTNHAYIIHKHTPLSWGHIFQQPLLRGHHFLNSLE